MALDRLFSQIYATPFVFCQSPLLGSPDPKTEILPEPSKIA